MPRIKQYDSSTKILTDDKAINAWETAGRRIGPLYNLAAGDIKDLGRYAAQGAADLEDLGAPKKKTVAETSTSSAGKGTASDGTDTVVSTPRKKTSSAGTTSAGTSTSRNDDDRDTKKSSPTTTYSSPANGSTVTSLTAAAEKVVTRKGESTETGPDYTKWNQAQMDLFNSGGPNADAEKAANAAAAAKGESSSTTVKKDVLAEDGGKALIDKYAPDPPKPKPASSSVWDLVSGIASSAYNGITTNTNPTSTSVDTSTATQANDG